MLYSSAELSKILKRLNSEYYTVSEKESELSCFVAAIDENIEDVRPDYDYEETQKNIEVLQKKIIKIKHSLNIFNTSTILPGFDITIDQALVYMPFLTKRIYTLDSMSNKSSKTRRINGNFIEYTYTNYDTEKAKKDYERLSDILEKLQLALDKINQEKLIELDI